MVNLLPEFICSHWHRYDISSVRSLNIVVELVPMHITSTNFQFNEPKNWVGRALIVPCLHDNRTFGWMPLCMRYSQSPHVCERTFRRILFTHFGSCVEPLSTFRIDGIAAIAIVEGKRSVRVKV